MIVRRSVDGAKHTRATRPSNALTTLILYIYISNPKQTPNTLHTHVSSLQGHVVLRRRLARLRPRHRPPPLLGHAAALLLRVVPRQDAHGKRESMRYILYVYICVGGEIMIYILYL